jgi:hypothetical protein
MKSTLLAALAGAVLLCLALTFPSAARSDQPQGGPRWEYHHVDAGAFLESRTTERRTAEERIEAGLNRLGAEGWELIIVSGRSYIFKRPLAASAAGG